MNSLTLRSPRMGGVLIFAYLLLSYSHFIFRYILQVSDKGTSPIYTDTPPELSAIKLVLLVILLTGAGWSAIKGWSTQIPPLFVTVGICLLISFCATCVKMAFGIPAPNALQDFWWTWLFTLAAIAIPLLCRPADAYVVLARFAEWSFWLCFAFWLVEVFLYMVYGRLPNLSFPGNPRFGGILDDPNSYGPLLTLLIALTLMFRGRFYRVRILLMTMMIVFTQSITSYLIAAAFGTFALAWNVLSRREQIGPRTYAALATVGVGAILAYTYLDLTEVRYFIESVWRAKQASADLHVSFIALPFDVLSGYSIPELLFGSMAQPTENFWSYTLLTQGVFGTAVFGYAIVVTLKAVYRTRRVYLFVWALLMVVGSVGVPYLRGFPLNTIFWITCLLAAYGSGVA